jgi:hypothetical protein
MCVCVLGHQEAHDSGDAATAAPFTAASSTDVLIAYLERLGSYPCCFADVKRFLVPYVRRAAGDVANSGVTPHSDASIAHVHSLGLPAPAVDTSFSPLPSPLIPVAARYTFRMDDECVARLEAFVAAGTAEGARPQPRDDGGGDDALRLQREQLQRYITATQVCIAAGARAVCACVCMCVLVDGAARVR